MVSAAGSSVCNNKNFTSNAKPMIAIDFCKSSEVLSTASSLIARDAADTIILALFNVDQIGNKIEPGASFQF